MVGPEIQDLFTFISMENQNGTGVGGGGIQGFKGEETWEGI